MGVVTVDGYRRIHFSSHRALRSAPQIHYHYRGLSPVAAPSAIHFHYYPLLGRGAKPHPLRHYGCSRRSGGRPSGPPREAGGGGDGDPFVHLLDALRIEFACHDAMLNAEARKKIDDPGYEPHGKELEDGPDSRYEYWP